MIGHRHGRYFLPVFFAVAGLVAPGCSGSGDDLPREAISGNVTLDGKALASGTIQFTPSGGDKSGVTVAGGSPITNGRYSIEREKGLVPGTYKVAVNAAGASPDAAAGKPAEPGRPTRTSRPTELIPSKYNGETKLTAEVKKGGPNNFEFALESK
jgi:hypothetical protein